MSAELESRAGEVVAPEHRGRTEIADRVLAKIAARALSEVEDAGGAARRVLGVRLGRDSMESTPWVTAKVDGGLATLRMRISVAYPAPVREVTRHLRELVRTRVGELTGLDVREVDIDVSRLPATGRRVR
ncbi:Asp23/Gls24 family envelope stress response protein [Actinoallomurus sp. NBC_01490]|uniref:Asp23/Gls24 family envelope stress response protein n=1 Tax=Actinoallomurus sp. NBC_01490 TaxID=2903557 RepID=UPI002E31DF08|nr:Asp23/Gls24 family envelope stress response protein [Actinoallomurus sp. NBC_01490]